MLQNKDLKLSGLWR